MNYDLINLYRKLKTQKKSFIQFCHYYFEQQHNTEDNYYELRELFNTTTDLELKAALFLYLNKHGYNGLCRYNSTGGYNVPYGYYKKPYFPKAEMEYFIEKAKQMRFVHADFQTTMKKATDEDIVYCDPPYIPLSNTANFTEYAQGGFNFEQQQVLVQHAKQLAANGSTVIISNHDTPDTRKLYQSAKLYSFLVPRFISCDSTTRTPAPELLAIFSNKLNF